MTFTDGGVPIGTGMLAGGVVSLTTTTLANGVHTIVANYAGDGNNNGSSSSSQTVTVGPSPTTTTLSSSASSLAIGSSVTFTATVAGSAPSGTVTFRDGGATIGTGTVSGGVASFSTSSLTAGSHSITAVYAGDANNATSTSAAVTVTVSTATSAIALTASSTTPALGAAVTFTATVSGNAPTGTVTFRDGATTIGTGTVSGGVASFSTSSLSAGAHSITAVYAGDANNAASTSAAVTVTVSTATSAIALTASTTTPALGAAVTFTATVTGNAPTGTVTFRDGATTIGTGTVSGGVASFSTSSLSAGAHSITAVYAGDANNAAATSSTLTVTVGGKAPTVRGSSLSVPYNGPGQPIDLSSLISGDFTGIQITTQPAHGTAVLTGGTQAAGIAATAAAFAVIYTPARGYSGPDSFSFVVTGPFGASAPATVSIIVGGRPDPRSSPDVNALVNAQVSSVRRFGQTQIDNVATRLEQIHDEDVPLVSNGLSFASADAGYRNAFSGINDVNEQVGLSFAERNQINKSLDSGFGRTRPGARQAEAPFAIWTGGVVSFGQQTLFGGTNTRFTTGGVTAGIDTRLAPGLRVGFAIGYGTDQSRFGALGNSRSNGDNVSGTLYSSYRFAPKSFIDFIFGYGQATLDSKRFDAANNAFLTGKRTGDQIYGSVILTYEEKIGAFKFAPYTRLDVVNVSLDPFNEQGPAVAALQYGRVNSITYSSVVGIRGLYPIDMSWGVLTPIGRLEYRHAFDGKYTQGINYADQAAGPVFPLIGRAASRDQFLVGVGARADIRQLGSLDIDYQYSGSASGDAHSVRGRWKVGF